MIKTLLAVVGLWMGFAAPASAAIAVDSPGVMGVANSATNAFAFTVGTGADRVLVVGAASTGNTGYFPVSSVTFAGTALTLEARTQYTDAVEQDVELWYGTAPTSGASGTVTVTYPGVVESVAGAIEYSGVDPFTTFGALTSGAASSDALSTTVTTLYPDSWVLLNAANYKNDADQFADDPAFDGGWGGQSGGTVGLFQYLATGPPGPVTAYTSYTDTAADVVIQQMAELVPLQPTATASPTPTPPAPTASPTPALTPGPQGSPGPTPGPGAEFAYPNPFFPDRPPLDHVTFALSAGHAAATLTILDLDLRTRWQGDFPPGAAVNWDGRDQRGAPLNSGVYLYLLAEDGRRPIRGSIVLGR